MAAAILLSNLFDRLLDEVLLSDGVRGKMKELKLKLKETKRLLSDAQVEDDRVVGELRIICLETEDIIETYAVDVANARKGGILNCISDHFCCRKLDSKLLNSKLLTFKEQIQDLNERLELCRVPNEEDHSDEVNSDPQLSLGGLVGMEEKQKLVEFGLKESPIIAVWGIGGIGKTTLARKVYQDEGIRRQFEAVAWVTLPQTFEIKSFLQDVLLQLNPLSREQVLRSMDIELAQQLYQSLQSRRYLIVFDDIWSMSAWDNIQMFFPTVNSASRILITTRIEDLAKRIAEKGFSFELKTLSHHDSWQLFLKKQTSDFIANHAAETIGKDVVKHCEGLPLAIAAVAGILATKHTLTHWKSVLKNVDSYPCPEQSSPEFSRIPKALLLSYDYLPYHLRYCFLSFGLFPEDVEIETETLINVWVAEGFVSSDNRGSETTMSDIAKRYLDELVMRSLISVKKEDITTVRTVKSCRIHDLLREMCLSKGKEENMFEVLDLKCGFLRRMDSYPSMATSRRLSVFLNSDETTFDSCFQQKVSRKVRSLLFLNPYPCRQGLSWPPSFSLRNFRLLRVLAFNAISFQGTRLPEGIENLANLRYLSLRNCYLMELPSSIENLSNLLTLDLRVSGGLQVTLPNVLWKLKHLRHLYLPCSFQVLGVDKLRLDGNMLLETLDNFYSSHCDAKDLLNLCNLRYLVAVTEGSLEDLEVIIKCMTVALDNLRESSLDLRNFDCYSIKRSSAFEKVLTSRTLHTLHMDGHLGRLPELFSPSLTEIFFSACEFTEDPMARLENLPKLNKLVLHNGAFIGKQMVCSAYGFPSLRCLKLSNLQKLERLTIEEGALAKLCTLTLERCKNLDTLPDGLIHLSSLQELNVFMMPETFICGFQKEGKDSYKTQHIPGINTGSPRWFYHY